MSVVLSACMAGPFLLTAVVQATNSTSDTSLDNTQKALVTVGVLAGCIIVALVIAKLVDYCYDRHMAINDAASDISEHTRNLIRSRLAVNAFRKSKKKTAGAGAGAAGAAGADDSQADMSTKHSKIIRIWSAKAKESRRIAEQRRAQDQAKALAGRADLIIRVEEASGEAKLKASLAATAASLTFESEDSNKDPGPSDSPKDKNEAGSSSSRSPIPIRPELKRTLTGLDSSNKIAEAPVTVAVSASGNTSILPEKGTTSPVLSVKESSSSKGQAMSVGEDGVDAFRSNTEGELAASTDKTDHGPSPEAKPSPPDKPGGSKTPEPKSQNCVSPKPGRAVSKSPSPNSPVAKTKSPDPPKSKTVGVKSPGVSVTRSPSPARKAVKQTVQTRAASPTKQLTSVNKVEPSVEKLEGGQQGSREGPKVESSPVGDKRESPPSPTRSPQPRPASSVSRKLFTAVRPTDLPTPTKSRNQSPEAKPKSTPSSPNKTGAHGKARPKSFHAKDNDKVSPVPKKLASSLALYGQTTDDLDKHKALVSKKKAAVSPGRPPATPAGKKLDQSPIVVAAAARKARNKSAKVGARIDA